MTIHLSVIIVANARYLVDVGTEQPVGASSFIRAIGDELKCQNVEIHHIGFQRDEALSLPKIVNVNNGTIIHFNFNILPSIITSMIGNISTCLTTPNSRICIWYQSPVFVPFHPPEMIGLVTHHGPFVNEAEKKLSPSGIVDAFQDTANKTDFLRQWQTKGVHRLISDPMLRSVEFSSVQIAALRNMGVPSDRIHRIAPRFAKQATGGVSSETKKDIQWLLDTACDVRLLSCCARVDGFKNLRSLVDAIDHVVAHGRTVRALIACGHPIWELGSRDALIDALPSQTIESIRLRPCYRQDEFLRLARQLGSRALFVFPSIYETFGITAVQANLMGMPVILKNDHASIGCLSYIRNALYYDGGTKSLACLLNSNIDRILLINSEQIKEHTDQIKEHMASDALDIISIISIKIGEQLFSAQYDTIEETCIAADL